MFHKFYLILVDFYKSIIKNEFFEVIVVPIAITVVLFFYIDNSVNKDFIENFNDSILSISALLVAFGISSITLLFSTSNKNIDIAKEKMTERKNSSNEFISYFQLIQIRSYYTILCEFLLILLTLLYKLLLIKSCNHLLFYININLLIHILFTLCLSIISMYHLSWKNR